MRRNTQKRMVWGPGGRLIAAGGFGLPALAPAAVPASDQGASAPGPLEGDAVPLQRSLTVPVHVTVAVEAQIAEDGQLLLTKEQWDALARSVQTISLAEYAALTLWGAPGSATEGEPVPEGYVGAVYVDNRHPFGVWEQTNEDPDDLSDRIWGSPGSRSFGVTVPDGWTGLVYAEPVATANVERAHPLPTDLIDTHDHPDALQGDPPVIPPTVLTPPGDITPPAPAPDKPRTPPAGRRK